MRSFFRYYLAAVLVSLSLMSSLNAQKKYSKSGLASFYADKFEGRQTANGEIYVHSKLTAAHRTLPFGTKVKVTNLENGKSVTVRVNDRGPFVEGRIIDLSKSAAIRIEAVQKGVVKVKVEELTDAIINNQVHPVNEYFQVNVEKKAISGFGVQVGSFSQMDNLIKMSNRLKEIVTGPMYVKVATVKGKVVNRLIVAVERQREQSEKSLKKLKKSFPDCFVVTL